MTQKLYVNSGLDRRINSAIEKETVPEIRDTLIDAREEIRALNNRIHNERVITITWERYQELIVSENMLQEVHTRLKELKGQWRKVSRSP